MRQVRLRVGSLVISVFVGASIDSIAQTAPPPSSTGAGSASSTAADSVASLTQEIRALNGEITQVVQQISQLQFAKPKPPAKDASDDARKQYAQALAAWENQRSSLLRRIDQLEARRKELEQRLEKLTSSLTAAQRADTDKQKQALSDAQRKLDQARVSLSASPTPSGKGPARQPISGVGTPAPGAGPSG